MFDPCGRTYGGWARPTGCREAASRGRADMKLDRLKAPTMFLAVVALVVGVSSGAVAAKLITGKDIKDGSVKSADIANGTLVTGDLKKGGVSADRLKAGSVGSGKLADGSVTSAKI